MGRVNRQARLWLAEILHGLITGNYARVAEIHFEAGYVPAHHNLAEFATALRAVGEPIRGLPVKDISIGQMLDGLFAITRDFDMPVQPHLLLLQKTMVMVEGVATGARSRHQHVGGRRARSCANGCAASSAPRRRSPSVCSAMSALLRRLPESDRADRGGLPVPGAAPPPPPLREVEVVRIGGGWRTGAVALVSARGRARWLMWWL